MNEERPVTQSPTKPRRLLPMLGHTQGTRSATVCHWRCADQCAEAHPARSASQAFAEVAVSLIHRPERSTTAVLERYSLAVDGR